MEPRSLRMVGIFCTGGVLASALMPLATGSHDGLMTWAVGFLGGFTALVLARLFQVD